jgi:hypothetical protein
MITTVDGKVERQTQLYQALTGPQGERLRRAEFETNEGIVSVATLFEGGYEITHQGRRFLVGMRGETIENDASRTHSVGPALRSLSSARLVSFETEANQAL